MKNAQRFNYESLSQVLGQRNLVEASRLEYALQNSAKGTSPSFPEVLVADELVGDWELSRIVCELYGLPFVPVDIYEPDLAVLEGLDVEFLSRHRLIPVARHGDLLTVVMPALVPADVLGSLAAAADVHVLPLVGTVETNNRWVEVNLSSEGGPSVLPDVAEIEEDDLALELSDPALELSDSALELSEDDALPALPNLSGELDWSNIFDEGDAAVLMDLTSTATAETDDDPEEKDLPPPLSPPAGP